MSTEEMQKQVLDAITSGKIPVASVHVGDNVEKKIIVEAGGIGEQTVNNYYGNKPDEELEPVGKRGPKPQPLFVDNKGKEDIKRTNEEKNRMRCYLSDHKLGGHKLNSSQDNILLKVAVCFHRKWRELGFVKEPAATAYVRFLVGPCGMQYETNQVSIANKLLEMIKCGEYDKDIWAEVRGYFN